MNLKDMREELAELKQQLADKAFEAEQLRNDKEYMAHIEETEAAFEKYRAVQKDISERLDTRKKEIFVELRLYEFRMTDARYESWLPHPDLIAHIEKLSGINNEESEWIMPSNANGHLYVDRYGGLNTPIELVANIIAESIWKEHPDIVALNEEKGDYKRRYVYESDIRIARSKLDAAENNYHLTSRIANLKDEIKYKEGEPARRKEARERAAEVPQSEKDDDKRMKKAKKILVAIKKGDMKIDWPPE